MSIDNQRMLDLLRVCRSELFVEHNLIDEEEYAWLAGLPSVATHARLKDYDALRAEVARLTTALAMAECNDERADLKLEVTRLTDLLASQRAEYETALAHYTDTVRDLTAEADAALSHQHALANERDKWIDGWRRVAGERDAEKAALAAEKAQTLKYQTALAREEAAHAATREELEGMNARLVASWEADLARAERAEAQLATLSDCIHACDREHGVARAALSASAPTEPRITRTVRPEVDIGGDEPTELRADLMRVAEAVREACSNIAYDDNVCGTMNRIDALDLAAIVAEVTK